jgi:putative efflux protein, MATE family
MPQSVVSHSIKSELKGTLALGIPLVISQSVGACSPFISTIMVAQLGQAALAANVLVYSAFMTMLVLFISMLDSVGVLVSHQYGAKNTQAISEIMGQGFLFGAIISVLFLIILASAPHFLNWHTQPLLVVQQAEALLRSLLWTIPGFMGWVVIQQGLQGMGNTKLILFTNFINIPLELGLIYCLVFGKFGFPICGIAGVGYGLSISFTLGVAIMIGYMMTSKHYRKLNLFTQIGKVNGHYLKELIRIGLPMGFMAFIEVSTFAMLTLWMSHFGTTTLAAHQIAMQYLGLFITVVFAISQTIAIRVGHAVGRHDLSGVQYATYVGVALNFGCILLLASAFYLFPYTFLSVDMDWHDPANADLIRTAKQFLSILSVFLLIESIRLPIGFGALRALKDARFTMLASLLSFWVIGLSASFLLSFVFHFNGKGLWWGATFGIAIGMVVVVVRWLYLVKRINWSELVHVTSPQHH